jgi:hypothetical protein
VGNGLSNSPSASPSGTVAGLTASPASPTQITTSPRATPSPSPNATSATTIRLFGWSRDRNQWVTVLGSGAGYREGETIQFLVRLDGVSPGQSYELSLQYDCSINGVAAIDYLTAPAESEAEAVLASPGPGRIRPDSTVPVPNDPYTIVDPGEVRFQLWGGLFLESPEGPLPFAPCNGEKEILVAVTAATDTLWLSAGGHLAAARDWGGQGAAGAAPPLTIITSLSDGVEAKLTVEQGAISP